MRESQSGSFTTPPRASLLLGRSPERSQGMSGRAKAPLGSVRPKNGRDYRKNQGFRQFFCKISSK